MIIKRNARLLAEIQFLATCFQKNVKTTALADHQSTVIRRVGFHVMSNAMY